MTCTWPHRWPELLPRSRNQRPPGHASIVIGNGLPPGICPSAPSCSSTAAKAISIGAEISTSLRISNVSTGWRSLADAFMLALSRVGGCRRFRLFPRPALGALLDAVELVAPEPFEGPDPVVHGL